MSDSVQPANVVRFGPFEANLQTGELRKYGIRIRLGRQPAQVLTALLERAGIVVSRDELRRSLWTDDTFVEFENGLNNAVKKLRQALGDSADKPLYVETLPRVGYRFIAPIQANGHPTADVSQSVPLPPPEPTVASGPRRWTWTLAPFATALVALVAYGFLSLPPVPRVTGFVRGTFSEHFDGFCRLITDGTRVFIPERSGGREIVEQISVAGGDPTPLDVPFLNTRIFAVSPDHSEFLIASFATREFGVGLPLWTWPVQGGSPVRVGNITAEDATWGPQGQHIFYSIGDDIRVAQRDGTQDRLFLHTAGRARWLEFSPDGRQLAFTLVENRGRSQALWIVSAKGANAHILFPGWSNPPSECCAQWTPDGKYFVFTSAHNGFETLWAVRQKPLLLHWAAQPPVQLTSSDRPLGGAILTRNGTRIFASAWNDGSEFVTYNPAARDFSPLPGLRGNLGVFPSPKGDWAVLQDSNWVLWRVKMDGSSRLQLTPTSLEAAQPRWSPDGTRVAFEASKEGELVRAYTVSANGGPIQPVLSEKGEQSVPSWSPDGSSIAVALNVNAPEPGDPTGIYIVDLKTHHTSRIPGSDGLTSPMWSPDGRYFTAKTVGEDAIMLFDPAGKSWRKIVSATGISFVVWSHDSRHLYEQNGLDPGQAIYSLRVGDFKRERVVGFEPFIRDGAEACAFQSVLPDGSLVVRLRRSGDQVFALDVEYP